MPKIWSNYTMVQLIYYTTNTNRAETKLIQIGFENIYCWREVDPTLLMSRGSISAEQSKVTTQIESAVNQFLDYCVTHPNQKLHCHFSEPVLRIHSDASYLSELKYCIISGEELFMVSHYFKKKVMVSASEAEYESLFHHFLEAELIRATLNGMGHPQPVTHVQTDNSI